MKCSFFKQPFLILLFLSVQVIGFAQLNAIFPEENADWVYKKELWDPMGTVTVYERFFYNGDTTIGGVNYAQLWQNNDATLGATGSFYYGAIRVDSAGRVFYLGQPALAGYCLGGWTGTQVNPEMLLYDWTRVVGDTNTYSLGGELARSTVVAIDTVMIAGVLRRRFEVSEGVNGNWDNRYEVEGIGSEVYFFWPWCDQFESINKLICFEDSTINYAAPGESCMGFLAVEEGLDKEVLAKVSPHPVGADSKFQLETTLLGEFDLTVFAPTGQKVFSYTMESNQTLPIGKMGLGTGMYFYQIGQAGHVLTTGKMVVR